MLHTSAILVGLLLAALFADGAVTAGTEKNGEHSAAWPQWRGPKGDGTSSEQAWKTDWPKEGPKKLWEARVGKGYSSFAIADGRLFTQGTTDGAKHEETVFCLGLKDGAILWKHPYTPSLPRARSSIANTPALSGGRLFVYGNGADLFCFEPASGKIVWQKSLPKENLAASVAYGYNASPLVTAGLVVVPGFPDSKVRNPTQGGGYPLTGGELFAFDAKNGSLVWRNAEGASAWSSPIQGTIDGRPTLINATGTLVLGIDPKDGKTLWKFDALKEGLAGQGQSGAMATTPMVSGNKIMFMGKTGGMQGITACISVSNATPKLLWKAPQLSHWYQSQVVWQDHLYGTDMQKQQLYCFEVESGKLKWSSPDYFKAGIGGKARNGCGFMIADGKLITLNAFGNLAVGEVSGTGHTLLAQAKVLDGGGEQWEFETFPVLADGRIYCRNSDGVLVCLDVSCNAPTSGLRP